MVFQESLKGVLSLRGVSWNVQGCFNEVLMAFTESLREFKLSLKAVSRKFRVCFWEVSGKLKGCFKNVSRMFQRRFKGISRQFLGFHWYLK